MRPIHAVLLGSALILVSVGVAMGQGAGANTGADVNTKAGANAEAGANANAKAGANAEATLAAIRDRAKNASSKAREAVEKQLAETAGQIDAEANQNGDIVVAGRVAPEFGMTAEAMMDEQNKFEAGLGDLVIAHTLMASSKTRVTARQLFSLRREGLQWGQIAYGLNLHLGEVAAAASSEGKVALGRAKADGKPAMIHSGTHAAASTNAGVRAGRASVGTASSVGVGVNVGK